jgi:hypothetical protein
MVMADLLVWCGYGIDAGSDVFYRGPSGRIEPDALAERGIAWLWRCWFRASRNRGAAVLGVGEQVEAEQGIPHCPAQAPGFQRGQRPRPRRGWREGDPISGQVDTQTCSPLATVAAAHRPQVGVALPPQVGQQPNQGRCALLLAHLPITSHR